MRFGGVSRALAVLALGAVAAVMPPGARADSRCDSKLVVFSRNSTNIAGSVNWNALACMPGVAVAEAKAIADGPADFRLITPNSDTIRVRYAEDVQFEPRAIKATLDGLGFDRRVILLARADLSLPTDEGPSWVYDGPQLSIAPDASGCLTVRATYTRRMAGHRHKVVDETTQFHTADALCG
jgi:hypothetical protein